MAPKRRHRPATVKAVTCDRCRAILLIPLPWVAPTLAEEAEKVLLHTCAETQR